MAPHELTLDWRPLYEDLYRHFIRPNADPPSVNDSLGKGKDLNNLTRLARYAQKYFPASEIPAILEKVLPEVYLFLIIPNFSSKHTSLPEPSTLSVSLRFSSLFNSRPKKTLLQNLLFRITSRFCSLYGPKFPILLNGISSSSTFLALWRLVKYPHLMRDTDHTAYSPANNVFT